MVYLDSIYMGQHMNQAYRAEGKWTDLPENLRYPFTKTDSVYVGLKVLANGNFPPEAVAFLTSPPPNPKEMILSKVDSSVYSPDQMEELAAEQAGELPLTAQPAPDSKAAFGGNQQNPNMMDVSTIMNQLNKIDADALGKQQAKDKVMKRKYSELPDQRKPEEGTKRNSLQNASVASRIYFGGNLSLTSTDPPIVDFGLQVGYWIGKRWLAGVGGSIREQFGGPATLVTGDSWGHSFFTRYDLPKGFFAYSEYERKKTESLFEREKPDVTDEWQKAFLTGTGKEFKAGPVRSQLMVLYDFTWRTNDLYARPLVIKMGFQISKKPR